MDNEQSWLDILTPLKNFPNVFHKVDRMHIVLTNAQLVYEPLHVVRNLRLEFPTHVFVSDIKAGSKNGLRAGFVISSQMASYATPNYVIFAKRSSFDPYEAVASKVELPRKYTVGSLLFFCNDDVVMATINDQTSNMASFLRGDVRVQD